MSDNKCFFCENEASADKLPQKSYSTLYDCNCCGKYLLDRQDVAYLSDPEVKFKFACILNERRLKGLPGIAIDEKTNLDNPVLGLPRIALKDLLSDFPKKASEYFNRAILNLSRIPKNPFEMVSLNVGPNSLYFDLFIKDSKASIVFLDELESQGLITFQTALARRTSSGNYPTTQVVKNKFFLKTRFWELVDRLQATGIDSKQAFVAMWFDSSMDDYYKEGIKPAITDAGYDPVRIDAKDFNGKICDEIIAEINRSKFIISDFSGQRGGVYFEAGYGMGQGKPVIFTVREEDVKDLHFDTRQYNHIVYTSPEDLRKKLYNRICATIV